MQTPLNTVGCKFAVRFRFFLPPCSFWDPILFHEGSLFCGGRFWSRYLHRALPAPSRRCELFRQPTGSLALASALQTALV